MDESNVFADVGVPAPESVSQVNVQTSVYDASVAGAGGSVQVVTKSGSNVLHRGLYEYLRNEAFKPTMPTWKRWASADRS